MPIENLRVSPGIVTADVDGERVVLAAPPIPAGIWAAIDVNAPNLAQTLEHTWEERLWPESMTASGSQMAVDAVRQAIEDDRQLVLRWRGCAGAPTHDDAWGAGELPVLPPPARRPPSSVPKRLGSSGLHASGEDLVAVLIRIYDEF